MFSPFRARRPEEPGSGGKAPRGRRRAASASPYAWRGNSQPSPPRPAGNPRWLFGIVTRAGRLLSTVFRSDSSETSSSYSSDPEGGGRGSSDEDENADAHTKFRELDETGRKGKSCAMHVEGPEMITQRSERRLAIEKLLLQETFSRDEGDRLIKIIQSRIVETAEGGNVAGQIELPDKTSQTDLTLLGTWRPLNRGIKFSEGLGYYDKHRSKLSPGESTLQAYSHDLCDKAITEAKKWLEKKKLESTSKAELDSGPCTLNTDTLQYRMEDELGSPVDIAKSYMREQPPWQSPILSSIGFKTPSTGMHLFEDETPHAIFSTSKALKRSYLATDFNGTRTVRLKSMESPPDSTIYHQVESAIATLEHACQTADERNKTVTGTNQDLNLLSAIETSKPVNASAGIPEKLADEDGVVLISPNERTVQENKLNSLPSLEMTELVDSSANVAAKVAVEHDHPEAISSAHNVKTFEVNHSTNNEVNDDTEKINETCNVVSTNSIPDLEDNVNDISLNHDLETETVLAPDKETGLKSLSSVSDCPDMRQTGAEKDFSLDHESEDIFIVEASQVDMEAPPPMEKQAKNVSIRAEFSSQETSVNPNDARDSVELLNAELEELASEDVKSPSSSNCNQASNDSKLHASEVHIDPDATEIGQDHRSPRSELLPASEVENTPVDTKLVDGEDHVEKEAILATGFTANGELSLQRRSSSKPYIRPLKKGSRRLPRPTTNGRSAASVPAETSQLSTDDPADAPINRGISGVQKPENGTTMKSIEQMLAENPPNSRHGRGRKVAARSRRGRGRGK